MNVFIISYVLLIHKIEYAFLGNAIYNIHTNQSDNSGKCKHLGLPFFPPSTAASLKIRYGAGETICTRKCMPVKMSEKIDKKVETIISKYET